MSRFEINDEVEVQPVLGRPHDTFKGVIVAYHGKDYHETLGKAPQLSDTYSVRTGTSTSLYPSFKLSLTKRNPSVEIKETPMEEHKVVSDGGPSGYYDFPESWNTFNDFIEYKSEKQWKGFSFHLGNIGKAICRWGDKDGTTEEYDAKKIIYSATRVLMMIIGVKKTREYLKGLLDDPQFKE